MNVTAPKTVAMKSMPLLVVLILTRKQAQWQWRFCADEHKHKWAMILVHLDKRIKEVEAYIGSNLDVVGFQAKREIIE
jgi:hypothetical protein